MNAIGYPRVSTEEQDFDMQVEKIKAQAAIKNLDLIEIPLDDQGESGKDLDRPGLNRVFEVLDSGSANVLIVWKLDRLTRSLRDWDYLVRNYFGEGCGCTLISVSESIDTSTAMGRAFLNFVILFAQMERETIVERTQSKLRHKKSIGERTGGIPYGKKIVDDGRRSRSKTDKNGRVYGDQPIALVDCPEEVEAIAFIIEARKEWTSLRRIAEILNERGVPTKSGRPWQHSSVQGILARFSSPSGLASVAAGSL